MRFLNLIATMFARLSFGFMPLRLVLITLLAAALLPSGCSKKAASGPMQMPPVQVVVMEAKRRPVSETLSLVGTVTANEMVEMKSETDGVVLEISFEEGQAVQKGQLLIRLDESKLNASQAEGEATFRLSKANFERSEQLFKDKLISQQEYDQAASISSLNQASLELRQRQLKDARIFAPFKGLVGARNISPGQVISKNTTLTWLVDCDPVKVEFNVPERFLSQLKIGQDIEIGVATFENRKFQGKVFFISPYVDPASRTSLVKAQIPNPKIELKPGMFANLDLTLQVRQNAIVIPEVALSQILDGERARIFVVDASQTVQVKEVKLGFRLPGEVEVVSGLEGGEKIVLEGIQKIGPGSKVKLAPPEAAKPYLKDDAVPEGKK
jgi:membrane fusion protein (multidrug efflux system)